MRHLDLFSGIGGFALAALNAWGKEYIPSAFCESDGFCQEILKLRFPGVKIYDDIKTFDAKPYAGTIDLLTGGFPCQPFSSAGNGRGGGDPRFLWPEMLRIIREVSPRWIVAENVYGLLARAHERIFERICLDLETLGYEIQPVGVPACAVGAPHQRKRIWFVGHAEHVRPSSAKRGKGEGGRSGGQAGTNETGKLAGPIGGGLPAFADSEGVRRHKLPQSGGTFAGGIHVLANAAEILPVADPKGGGFPPPHAVTGGAQAGDRQARGKRPGFADENRASSNAQITGLEGDEPAWVGRPYGRFAERAWRGNWIDTATRLCGMDDGLPGQVDGFKLSKSRHRKERIKTLGNAIVPQVAARIFLAIKDAGKTENTQGE